MRRKKKHHAIVILGLAICLCLLLTGISNAGRRSGASDSYQLLTVSEGLAFPWRATFLSQNEALITERSGRIRYLNLQEGGHSYLGGVPDVVNLFDIVIDKSGPETILYLAFTQLTSGRIVLAVHKSRLLGTRLQYLQTLFASNSAYSSTVFSGGRLLLLPDQSLLLTVGDQPEPNSQAQDASSHAGSIVKISTRAGFHAPEIVAKGIRNSQGLERNSVTGAIWFVDHGPVKGDELDKLAERGNYGWPIETSGARLREPDGLPTSVRGFALQKPIYIWPQTIAPSGLAFYQGDRYPAWKGHLLVGSLVDKCLHVLEIRNNKVVSDERFFKEAGERIRDVSVGLDGYVYLLTDRADGKFLRISRIDGSS